MQNAPDRRLIVLGTPAPDWLAQTEATIGAGPATVVTDLAAVDASPQETVLIGADVCVGGLIAWLAQPLDADALSPLSAHEGTLSPWAPGADPAGLTPERASRLLSWLPGATAMPSAAASTLAVRLAPGQTTASARRHAVCAQALVWQDGRSWQLPTLPADARETPPPPAWAAVSERLEALKAEPALADLVTAPLAPVVLHVSHDWGGGSESFIRDLARADGGRRHYLLKSFGHHSRQRHGEGLRLVPAIAPTLTLAEWTRAVPITTLDRECGLYAGIAAQLGADGIVVSSLIGHGLDALTTGLPTTCIVHDYFPLWPHLGVDFGDTTRARDLAELQATRWPTDSPFAPMPAAEFWMLRAAFLAVLRAQRPAMVCPSAHTREHWQRLAPETAALDWRVIPHGLPPLGPPVGAPPIRPTLRVLVPGRIAGAKGETLLKPLIAATAGIAEFLLVGAGRSGMGFFGMPGVDVIPDYDLAQLPTLLDTLRPDLALLPRSVAETFSYSLSEMQALGLPVLATANGAYPERIRDGVDGLLAAPTAAALAERLRALAADRSILTSIRAELARLTPRSTAEMAHDYAPLLPLLAQHRPRPPAAEALAAALPGAQRLTLLRRALAAADVQLDDAQRELLRRAEWALDQQRLAESRTAWALSLEQETQRLTGLIAAEQARFAEVETTLRARVETAEGLAAETVAERAAAQLALQQTHEDLAATRAALGASGVALTDAEQRLSRSEQVRNQLAAELVRAQAAHAEISASSFWRATAPLRHLAHALKQLAASTSFRVARAQTLLPRLLRSLKLRGVKGTLTRISAEFDTTPPVTNTAVLPAETPFEVFDVPRAAKPVVSIVIPVYNKFDYTLRCLRALATLPDRTPWEAIVIDDGSSDETWERLQQIRGIRAERNPQNLGFIGASNRGVALARGTHILFLNNDTAIQPGAIDQLMAVFRQRPDAGLVGAKLVYPDGRLQECGGIIFNDGSGWNYGRFGDPAQCEYQFLREVDYCSGAAILIPRALLDQLGGGFDPLYTPAYYEDTDLAFKVRGAGKKVYVQPAAVVVHYEGISSGTDITQGIKRYQVVNQQKFLDRWHEVLATHPAPGTRIEHARSHRRCHRVLFIDATIPTPDQDSGSVRVINLLQVLQSLGAEMSFLTENRAWFEGYTPALQQMGVEALYHPYVADVPQWFAAHAERFDTFILSRHYVAVQYLTLIRQHAPQAKVVFDTVDLHYLREQRAAALAGDYGLARAAEQTRTQELKLIADCDLSWVVSPAEQELLASDAPGRPVAVVSNIYPVVGCRASYAERADLIFVGGFQHTPNVDAMRWFVAEVWPRVADKLPDCLLNIVGSKMPPEIAALASKRVIVHGYVPSVEPLIDRARINLAPLRYGAGVKGKINSALAHGLPTVATTLAVEGMHLTDGVTVLTADSPEAIAAAIVRLYRDRALWEKLSAAGLAHVEAHYSLGAARRQVASSLGWSNTRTVPKP